MIIRPVMHSQAWNSSCPWIVQISNVLTLLQQPWLIEIRVIPLLIRIHKVREITHIIHTYRVRKIIASTHFSAREVHLSERNTQAKLTQTLFHFKRAIYQWLQQKRHYKENLMCDATLYLSASKSHIAYQIFKFVKPIKLVLHTTLLSTINVATSVVTLNMQWKRN